MKTHKNITSPDERKMVAESLNLIFALHYSKSKGTGRWLVHSTAMPKVAFLTYEVGFFLSFTYRFYIHYLW